MYFSVPDLSAEGDDGGPPAAGFRRRVTKLRHKGCPRKHGADHFALRSDAAPVDDAQGAIPHPVRFDEVFFYNGAHIPGWDGVLNDDHTSELQSLRHLVCRLL